MAPPPDPTALGREGERRAARFLRTAGYKVLCRNFRPQLGGEVDLVCRHRRRLELVFVEVKTRSSAQHGAPAEAVDWEKQQRLVLAAREWLQMLDWPAVAVRFDVIEVRFAKGAWEISHLPGAFTAEETRHPGSAPLIPGANRGDVLPKRGRAGGAPSRRRPCRG